MLNGRSNTTQEAAPVRPLNSLESDSNRETGIIHMLLANQAVLNKTTEIKKLLETKNPPLNPNRTPPSTWDKLDRDMKGNKLAPNVQDVIALSTALDIEYSESYKTASTNLESKMKKIGRPDFILQVMNNLKATGEVSHIEHEGAESNYHRTYHPRESAEAAALVLEKIQPDLEKSAEEQALAKAAFAYHDVIQRDMKTATLNEIESADLFAKDWFAQLEVEKQVIQKNNTLDSEDKEAALAALEEYKTQIPYVAWKTIVPSTTMLKTMDGQPTIYSVQKMVVESFLPQKDKNKIAVTALDRVAFTLSLVDSNLPALAALLKTHPEIAAHLPDSLVTDENFSAETRKKLQELATLGPVALQEDPDNANKSGLLLGQNNRMFSEIHETWFGALKKAHFTIDNKEIDGVRLWNEAMEASRGNDAGLKQLLSVASINKVDLPFDKPPSVLPTGQTIMDIFINRLGGEVIFSKGQGPEYYAKVAGIIGIDDAAVKSLQIDDRVWKNHAERLQALSAHYTAADDLNKQEIARALFLVASHQPGVYLESDNLLQNIQQRKEVLDNEKTALAEKILQLKAEINSLEKQENLLRGAGTASPPSSSDSPQVIGNVLNKEPATPISSTQDIGNVLNKTFAYQIVQDAEKKKMAGAPDVLGQVQQDIKTAKAELDNVTKKINNREQVWNNLDKAQVEYNYAKTQKASNLNQTAAQVPTKRPM